MAKILFLDDMEIRHTSFKRYHPTDDITFVKTAQEAINILEKDLEWDLICLDHDLGNRIFVNSKDTNTGSEVARYLKDKEILAKIIIHTCNPIGAMEMTSMLPKAIYCPLWWQFGYKHEDLK